MSDGHRGHCRCGKVEMTAQGEPEISVYCHCDDCRRSTGAPVLSAVAFKKDNINWTASSGLKRFTNGTASRLFCADCGSPVAQEHESAQDRTYFNTGFMDEPEKFPPTFHSYEGEQLSWLALTDDLPRAKTTVSIKRP